MRLDIFLLISLHFIFKMASKESYWTSCTLSSCNLIVIILIAHRRSRKVDIYQHVKRILINVKPEDCSLISLCSLYIPGICYIKIRYTEPHKHIAAQNAPVCVNMFVCVSTDILHSLDSPLTRPKGSPHTEECPSHVLTTPLGTKETTASPDLHHCQPRNILHKQRKILPNLWLEIKSFFND